MAGDNKLTFDPPTRLPELTLNLIGSSHGHSTPSLKISCKSVQPFYRNVADKETKKQTKKEIERKQYPVPYRGWGNDTDVFGLINHYIKWFVFYRNLQKKTLMKITYFATRPVSQGQSQGLGLQGKVKDLGFKAKADV